MCLVGGIAAQAPPTIESLLVLERTGAGGRVLVAADALQARIVRGEWTTPAEGEEVALDGGRTRRWRRIRPGDDGTFRDRALAGGWAVASVDAPRAGIWLLDAVGPARVDVNGSPRIGDGYSLGTVRIPIALRQGRNELRLRAGRSGSLRLRLEPPPAPAYFEDRDRTLPDVLAGQAGTLLAGLIVANAGAEPLRDLSITATSAGGVTVNPVPTLLPCALHKVAVELPVAAAPAGRVAVELTLLRGDTAVHATTIELPVRAAHDTHRRTFRSGIDGSVQYYAVTPAEDGGDPAARPGVLLSLHGAGVEAEGQARCYARKTSGHVVAPTNRRPYGFDWEDIGRLDALEVLAHARAALDADPRRTWLTGHSMGGHGTWQLGAHFPDRFAAIGPSAGWRDFDSYGSRRRRGADPDDSPTAAMLRRAANASRTLLLADNWSQQGVYVLHGDADETVPVAEARAMRTELARFHADFAYYEHPGAGHWWGNQCMDWPPLIAFLARHALPAPADVRRVRFTTVHPGISATCHWLAVEAQQQWMQPTRVEITLDPERRAFSGSTDNATHLRLDLRPLAAVLAAGAPLRVRLDDGDLEAPWPDDGLLALARTADGWSVAPALAPPHKQPRRAGPFKAVFDHRVLLVYATGGSDDDNARSRAKARFDAETLWYRGNGAAEIVADVDLDARVTRGRNVVLYGGADSNRAWTAVVPAECPIAVRRGAVRVGDRELAGDDLACLFVYRRAGSATASVAVVAGTGDAGARAADVLPYFVSGVGIPDWIVLGADAYESGSAGVRGAGYFDGAWALDDAQSAWR